MTDKQIIIDGVDVKKCVYHESGYCTISKEAYCYCCDKPNCHYKNWQRKEQECEELKFQNKRLDEVASYWHKRIFKVERSERKLKATLAEIKEIAEIAVNFCKGCGGEDYECIDCTNGGRAQISKEILQKISECEVE